LGIADLAIRSERLELTKGLRDGVLRRGEIAFGAMLVVFQMN